MDDSIRQSGVLPKLSFELRSISELTLPALGTSLPLAPECGTSASVLDLLLDSPYSSGICIVDLVAPGAGCAHIDSSLSLPTTGLLAGFFTSTSTSSLVRLTGCRASNVTPCHSLDSSLNLPKLCWNCDGTFSDLASC